MIFFVLLVNCFNTMVHFSHGAGELSLQRYIVLTDSNLRFPGNIISTFTSDSKVQCGKYCGLHPDCVAMGYHQLTHSCELYKCFQADISTALPIAGWTIYAEVVSTGQGCSNNPYELRFSSTAMNMAEANKSCIDAGERLVTIKTVHKMEYIRYVIQITAEYQNADFWTDGTNLHATDYLADDAWTFYDGSVLPKTGDFWCQNKPDNANTEHCVRLMASCGHLWNDRECEKEFRYICEP